MAEPTPPASQFDPDPDSNSSRKEDRLDSWGEIAAYLDRDIRTVQRWEDDFGLPVKRLGTARQGRVFAYKADLDRWMQERTKLEKPSRLAPSEEIPPPPMLMEGKKTDPSIAEAPELTPGNETKLECRLAEAVPSSRQKSSRHWRGQVAVTDDRWGGLAGQDPPNKF